MSDLSIPRPSVLGSKRARRRGRPRLRVVPEATSAEDGSQVALTATLVVLVVLLGLIGSVMILSASSVTASADGGSSFGVFFRQCGWLAVGLAGMYLASRVDYHRWASWVPVLVLGSIGLLVAVLIPGVGISVNGAQRWLGHGQLSLQPAEPAKLALVVFVATLVSREQHRISDHWVVLRPVLLITGTMVALLMLQPNLGTSAVLCATVGCMLLVAGLPFRVLSGLAAVGALGGAVFALSAPYRRARVTAFLDPWADAGDTGYQTIQSLIGVASGGVSGTGLGASRAKWGFLPEAHTDFVFSIIGEELGFVGSLFVVGLFAALVACTLHIASRATDRFGSMLAVGVSSWFAIQGFVNVGAVLGILPITGVPLPFVSFGGSSLLATMVAAGILANVAMQSRAPEQAVRARIAARRAANASNAHDPRSV